MDLIVRVPGSCGELVQGWVDGEPFLGTCPIDIYSTVCVSRDFDGCHGLGEKSRRALHLTLERLGEEHFPYGLSLQSDIPQGKGMASSSADIAAVVVAVTEALGQGWSPEQVLDIAAAIEPTDGVFCPGIVLMNQIEGRVLSVYDRLPAMRIAIFDLGGTINTCAFHASVGDFDEDWNREAAYTLAQFRWAMTKGDAGLLAQAATRSAMNNQHLLWKAELPALERIARKMGALGINVAHSGTVAGVLWPADYSEEILTKKALQIAAQAGLEFMRLAWLRPGGVEIKRLTGGRAYAESATHSDCGYPVRSR